MTSTSIAACASISRYVTEPLVDRIRWALVDRFARKGKLPSDHAPLLVDIDVDAA